MKNRSILSGVLLTLCIFLLSACGTKKENVEECIETPGVESVYTEIEEVAEIEETEISEEMLEEVEHTEIPKEYYYYASILTDILNNPNFHVNVLTDYGIYCQIPPEFAFADIDGDSEQELLIKSMTSGYVEDAVWDVVSIYKFSNNWGIEPNYQYVGDVTFYDDDSVLISFADLYTKDDEGVLIESDLVDIEFYEMSNLIESFTIGKDALATEEGEALINELTEGKHKVDLSWEIISPESIMNLVNSDFANSDFLDDKYDLTNYIRFMNRGRNTEEHYTYSVIPFVNHCVFQGMVNDGYSTDMILKELLPSFNIVDDSDYDNIVYRVGYDELAELADKLYRIKAFTEDDLQSWNLKRNNDGSIEGSYTLVSTSDCFYKLQLFDYYEENENIVIKGICHNYDEGILCDYFECTLHETDNGILNGYEVIGFISESLWQRLF